MSSDRGGVGAAPDSAALRLSTELRLLRMRRGVSLRRLARQLGLSAHSNLSEYELGRRLAPRDIVLAYGRVLADSGRLAVLYDEALEERARRWQAEHGMASVAAVDR